MSSAVSVGEFDAWLKNTSTGTWYPAGASTPVAGQTVYTQSFSTAGIPAGTYTAVVYYRPDATVWGNWQANGASPVGAVTITPALSITVTSPATGAVWGANTPQNIGFTLNSAVGVGGEFDTWLINTATNTWYPSGFSSAVALQTIYSHSFSTAGIPAGTYTSVIYYRPDATVWGNWQANGSSAAGALTIQ